MSTETPTNVVMLLTPPGAAAIAVVRIAGRDVGTFLAARFSALVPDGRCVHGLLCDEAGDVLDDAVVVCSAGQTVADLNLHGGAWVVESVLALCGRAGFARIDALAAPSVAHRGATSELEREVLADLPRARTELALKTLLAQPAAWAALLDSRPGHDALVRVLAHPCLAQLLNPPRVAIVGAPNVGKSTLANQLFGEARSITADLPGTTRDWVGATANIDGLAVTLVDTPGVRRTDDPIEREAIERSRGEVRRADLVLRVHDSTRLAETKIDTGVPQADTIEVYNKTDIDYSLWRPLIKKSVKTSAIDGGGVDTLRDMIRDHFRCGKAEDFTRAYVWTDRQRDIVARAIDNPSVLREVVIGVSTG